MSKKRDKRTKEDEMSADVKPIQATPTLNDFFVFVFSASHAQLYDKRHLQGGTVEDFRRFIETATEKQVLPIK